MNYIKSTQEIDNKDCKRLCRKLDYILEQFGMDIMENLEEESPVELNTEDMETRRNISNKTIEATEEVNNEVLEENLINPIKLNSLAK
jgi:hypothetical protein